MLTHQWTDSELTHMIRVTKYAYESRTMYTRAYLYTHICSHISGQIQSIYTHMNLSWPSVPPWNSYTRHTQTQAHTLAYMYLNLYVSIYIYIYVYIQTQISTNHVSIMAINSCTELIHNTHGVCVLWACGVYTYIYFIQEYMSHECVYMYMFIHSYIHTYTHTHVYANSAYMYTYTHIYTFIDVHTQISINCPCIMAINPNSEFSHNTHTRTHICV